MRVLKANRQKSRSPRKRLFWCGCDRSHIGHSGKCSHCGATYKGSKDRKAGPAADTE